MSTNDDTASQSYAGGMSPIVPPKEEPSPFSVRLPPSLVKEIDLIAKSTDRSRNSAMEFLLRWAVQEARRELEASSRSSPEPLEPNKKKK